MKGPHVVAANEAERPVPPSLCCSEGPRWAAEPLEHSQDSGPQNNIQYSGAPWAPPAPQHQPGGTPPDPERGHSLPPRPPRLVPALTLRPAAPDPAPQLSINRSVQRAVPGARPWSTRNSTAGILPPR